MTGLGSDLDSDVKSDGTPTPSNNQPVQLGSHVMWHNPVMTTPDTNFVTCLERIIKTLDRWTYSPAVELQYLGEMMELDNAELVAAYMLL